jgi:hypothetical protein
VNQSDDRPIDRKRFYALTQRLALYSARYWQSLLGEWGDNPEIVRVATEVLDSWENVLNAGGYGEDAL